MAGRVTQAAVEALAHNNVPTPRVNQVGLELLFQPSPNADVKQAAVEALVNAVPNGRVTQVGVEVLVKIS